MSYQDFLGPENIRNLPEVSEAAPAFTLGQVASSTMDDRFRNRLSVSKNLYQWFENSDNRDRYETLFGSTLFGDVFANSPNGKELRVQSQFGTQETPELTAATDAYLTSLHEKGIATDILTSADIENLVKEKAVAAHVKAREISEGATTFDNIVGGLAGGIVPELFEPWNWVAGLFSAGIASSYLRRALVEGSINVGVSVATDPFVKAWQDELGLKYDLSERATDAAMAGIFGAGMGVATKFLFTPKQIEGVKRAGSIPHKQLVEHFENQGRPNEAVAAQIKFMETFTEESRPKLLTSGEHQKLLTEGTAAAKEGRAPRYNEIVPDLEDRMKAIVEGNEKLGKIIDGETGVHPTQESPLDAIRSDKKAETLEAQLIEDHNTLSEKIDPDKPSVDDFYEEDVIPDIANVRKLSEFQDSDQFMNQQKTQFDEIVTNKADERITADEPIHGETQEATYRELADELEADAKDMKALTGCDVGSGKGVA